MRTTFSVSCSQTLPVTKPKLTRLLWYLILKCHELGVTAHTCILPSPWEVEAGAEGQPPLNSMWATKTLFSRKKEKRKKNPASNYCHKNNYLLQCQILSRCMKLQVTKKLNVTGEVKPNVTFEPRSQ